MSLMVRLMNVIKLSILFLSMSFLLLPILQCSGQSSGFRVLLDQYNWNSEMKAQKITNPEIGLILKITIWNDGSEPIDFTYSGSPNNILWINVQVDSTTDSGVYFFQQLQIDDLYLPPNETLTRFVNVEFTYSQPIGIYMAKVTYNFGSSPSEGQPVEGSPFSYSILDNNTFNQEIKQSKNVNVTWVSLTLNFSLITLGDFAIIGVPSISGVTIVSLTAYAYKNRKGKTQKENNSRSHKQRTKSSSK